MSNTPHPTSVTPVNLNPTGLDGIDFVEFTSPDPAALHKLFQSFGFSRVARHATRAVDLYVQRDITLLLNREPGSFASGFQQQHGPSISSMGWRCVNAADAATVAVSRGARPADVTDYHRQDGSPVPAIYGVGDSLIYFVDDRDSGRFQRLGFVMEAHPDTVPERGFTAIDHLTNNVYKGTMAAWSDFYKSVFGFTEVRYFDIRGVKTGLTSFALRSPCGKFAIPINEASEKRSQINEYLDEYKGPGIQHLAFRTADILGSLDSLKGSGIGFLDIDDEYYATVFDRVPHVREDHTRIQEHKVLVDGDEEGYLLQIFTKNLVGPIFVEIIQRHNHEAFGEGNFGALFRAIERDQMRRGVL